MPSDQPTPPSGVPSGLVDVLDDCSSERLRDIASYAESLAGHREREARLAATEAAAEPTMEPDTPPEGVPAKATLTTKTINDNRYYYWQWRDGDQVKSKYHGPVDG